VGGRISLTDDRNETLPFHIRIIFKDELFRVILFLQITDCKGGINSHDSHAQDRAAVVGSKAKVAE
jgi:hypothetical protein